MTKAEEFYPFFDSRAMTEDPLSVYPTHTGIIVFAGKRYSGTDKVLFAMQREVAVAFAEAILEAVKDNE